MKAVATNRELRRISLILVLMMTFSTFCSPKMFNENIDEQDGGIENQLLRGLTTPESPSVFGYVIDQDGDLLTGVNVSIDNTSYYSHTDHIGHYILEDVDVGMITLRASRAGCNDTVINVENVGWTRVNIGMVCYYDIHDIFGAVTDINTQIPLAGVTMTLGNSTTGAQYMSSTDVGGEYSFIDIPEGIYQLEANHDLYDAHKIEVILNRTAIATFVLKITDPSNISGKVLGLRGTTTLEPIVGAMLILNGTYLGKTVFGPFYTSTDSNGEYSFDDLPPVDYEISVAAMGYDNLETEIQLTANESLTRDLILPLRPVEVVLEFISSTYLDEGGNPMPLEGFQIELNGQTNSAGRLINQIKTTNSSGKVAFNNLVPPGTYIVKISSPSLIIDNVMLEFENPDITIAGLEPNESREIVVDMTPLAGDVFGLVNTIDDLSYNISVPFNPQHYWTLVYRNISGDCRYQFYRGIGDVNEICEPANVQHLLSGATIRILSSTLNGYQVNISQTTYTTSAGEAKGAYSMTLPPGHHNLRIEKPGLESFTFDYPISIYSGIPWAMDTITLLPTWSDVAGYIERKTIVNHETITGIYANESLSNSPLRLVSSMRTYAGNTSENGLFKFTEIEAGNYTLYVDDPSYSDSFDVEVPSGGRLLIIKRTASPPNTNGLRISHMQDGGAGNTYWGPYEQGAEVRVVDEEGQAYNIIFPMFGALPTYQFAYGQYQVYISGVSSGYGSQILHYNWNASASGAILNLESFCPDTEQCYRTDTTSGVSKLSSFKFVGYVFDHESGEPIANASVFLVANAKFFTCCTNGYDMGETLVSINTPSVTTDANGKYEINYPVFTGVWHHWYLDGYHLDVNKSLYEPNPQSRDSTSEEYGIIRNDFLLNVSGGLTGTVYNEKTNQPIIGTNDFYNGVRVYSRSQMAVTNSNGVFEIDPLTPGLQKINLEATGYYPSSTNVQIYKGNLTSADFQLYPIPPPKIFQSPKTSLEGAFAIWVKVSKDEHPYSEWRELEGYILKDALYNDDELPFVDGYWEVKVDREGHEVLRPGFDDPVTKVWVEVKVIEACEGSPNPVGYTVNLIGKQSNIEGSISTWEGQIDVRELPCGKLNYKIHATTGMSLSDETDWSLMPVRPSMSTFLVSMFMSASSHPNIEMDFFAFESERMKIEWNESSPHLNSSPIYLEYKIGNASMKASIGVVVNNAFAESIGPGGFVGFKSLKISAQNVIISGKTGELFLDFYSHFALSSYERSWKGKDTGLSFDFKITEPSFSYIFGAKGICQQGVINPYIDSSTSFCLGAPQLIEGFEIGIGFELQKSIPLPGPAAAIQTVLQHYELGDLVFIVEVKYNTAFQWPINYPTLSLNPLSFGMRLINQQVDASFKLEVGAKVKLELFGSHISVGIHAVGVAEMSVKEVNDNKQIFMNRVHVYGSGTYDLKFLIFTKKGEFLKINFVDWKRGTTSNASLTYIDEQDFINIPNSISEPINPVNISTTLVSPTEQISLSSDYYNQTGLVIAHTNNSDINANDISPALVLEDSNGQWLEVQNTPYSGKIGSQFSPAIHHLSDGRIISVWSQLPEIDELRPTSALMAMAATTLDYAIYDPLTNTWGAPNSIISEEGMRYSPKLSSHGEEIHIVWIEDIDANPMTITDAVVMHSTWAGQDWSPATMVPGSKGIESIPSIAATNEGAVLSFIKPHSNDSVVSVHIFEEGEWDSGNIISDENHSASTPQSLDLDEGETIIWVEDGNEIVMYSRESNGSWVVSQANTFSQINSLCATPSVRDLYAIVWAEPTDNGSILRALVGSGNTWNNSVIEIVDEEYPITQIEAVIEVSDGRLIVAYVIELNDGNRLAKVIATNLGISDSNLPDLITPKTVTGIVDYWHTNPVLITLNSSDERSGIDKTEYRVNGGEWRDYLHPINLSQEGEYSIDYRSIDNGGNIEPINEVKVGIDTTPPTVELNISSGPIIENDDNNSREVDIRWSMGDSGSGISSIELLVNGEQKTLPETSNSVKVILVRGNHTIQLNVYDEAGNIVTETVVFEVIIDEPIPPIANDTNDTNAPKSNLTTITIATAGSVGVVIALFGFLGAARSKKKSHAQQLLSEPTTEKDADI